MPAPCLPPRPGDLAASAPVNRLAQHLTQSWYRSRAGRVIAGICMGLARQFGVSVSLVRLAFVLATFIGGWGIILYVALWFIMPLEPFVPRYEPTGERSAP